MRQDPFSFLTLFLPLSEKLTKRINSCYTSLLVVRISFRIKSLGGGGYPSVIVTFLGKSVRELTTLKINRGFHKFTKISNIGIIVICVFQCICSFLLYSNHIILVNAKLETTGFKRKTCQGWILQWSYKFLMA